MNHPDAAGRTDLTTRRALFLAELQLEQAAAPPPPYEPPREDAEYADQRFGARINHAQADENARILGAETAVWEADHPRFTRTTLRVVS